MTKHKKKFNKTALNWKLFHLRKAIHLFLKPKQAESKRILFIVGCQRSGTSLLARRVFGRDINSKTYGEYSVLTSDDVQKLRLNQLGTVRKEIFKNRAPLVVIKALVESQNTNNLLEYFGKSKALWVYRHYKDVGSSNLARFGVRNGIADLRPVTKKDPNNWRSENTSEYTTKLVSKYFSENMNPNDAAALFWFVRNRLFFELNLEENSNVMLCLYDQLVKNPNETMKNIYKFIGRRYPGKRILTDVHSNSMGKGKKLQLSPEIDLLCGNLYEMLNRVHRNYIYGLNKFNFEK